MLRVRRERLAWLIAPLLFAYERAAVSLFALHIRDNALSLCGTPYARMLWRSFNIITLGRAHGTLSINAFAANSALKGHGEKTHAAWYFNMLHRFFWRFVDYSYAVGAAVLVKTVGTALSVSSRARGGRAIRTTGDDAASRQVFCREHRRRNSATTWRTYVDASGEHMVANSRSPIARFASARDIYFARSRATYNGIAVVPQWHVSRFLMVNLPTIGVSHSPFAQSDSVFSMVGNSIGAVDL